MNTVAGIDVGGSKKGLHVVALRGTDIVSKRCFESGKPENVVKWCIDHRVTHVAVDAPCSWSRDGHARESERELMAEKIWCFSTPLRATAVDHPKNQYGWMLAGEALYGALMGHYELFRGVWDTNARYCAETFPHAVACVLSEEAVPLSAKEKSKVRRKMLTKAGIDASRSQLPNIDFVDAALCAVAASCLARDTWETYGSMADGLIVVPRM